MNKKKVFNIIKNVLMLGAVVFFVIIAICQFYASDDMNKSDDRIVLGINGTGSESFSSALKGRPVPMGELVGIVSGGNFMVIDKKGDVKTTENFMLSNPILHSKGDFCIVADYHSDKARLYEKGKLIAEVETEDKILSVVANKSGYFAVATETVGYDCAIVVYKKDATPVYRYRVAKNTFIDMDISNNHRKLIIAEADMSGERAKSKITIAELNVEESVTTVEKEDDIYINVHFNKDSSFVALGTASVDLYRADGKLETSVGFEKKNLICADITEDDMIAIALKGPDSMGNGVCVLKIYDRHGKLRGEKAFSEEITHLCVNKSYIAVSHGDVVEVLKSNCSVKKIFETTSPVKYAAPFSKGDAAVIFSGGNTTIMK